jgi:hypothetical protein
MSDHSPSNRRIPSRILPVGKLEPSRLGSQHPALDRLPPTPQQPRVRAYGSPLSPQVRAPRTVQNPVTPNPNDVDAETSQVNGGNEWLTENKQEHQPDSYQAKEDFSSELSPGIIWEQIPEPIITSEQRNNTKANLIGSIQKEKHYAALGSYLAVMIDGFTAFCNTPSVTQSGMWHARLPMPDEILPETILEVKLSADKVNLRFESSNLSSKNSLVEHVEKLQTQVRKALDNSREVEITVW